MKTYQQKTLKIRAETNFYFGSMSKQLVSYQMTLEPTDSDWFANGIYVRGGLNVKYNIVSGVFLTKS